MTRGKRDWYWPYPRPEWEPLPERTPGNPRAPGRQEDNNPRVIASSEEEDTSNIEAAIEELRSKAGRGKPPPAPPGQTILPPWSPDDGGKRVLPPWSPDDGTDRCAWYMSFRFGSAFGIYICSKCLVKISHSLWIHGLEDQRAWRVAFAFLYGHELFHYRVDRGVELLENCLATATGVASPLWSHRWIQTRHSKHGSGLDLLEEACANQQGLAAALKMAIADDPVGLKRKRTKAIKHKRTKADADRDKATIEYVLQGMMRNSGPGYRDFENVSKPFVSEAQDELMSWYLLLNARGAGRALGPIQEIRRVIPMSVKKGNLGTDPSVPLKLVDC